MESPTLNVVALGEIEVVLTTCMVEGVALAGATGPAIVASTPAMAIHSGRRERDFMTRTSE